MPVGRASISANCRPTKNETRATAPGLLGLRSNISARRCTEAERPSCVSPRVSRSYRVELQPGRRRRSKDRSTRPPRPPPPMRRRRRGGDRPHCGAGLRSARPGCRLPARQIGLVIEQLSRSRRGQSDCLIHSVRKPVCSRRTVKPSTVKEVEQCKGKLLYARSVMPPT